MNRRKIFSTALILCFVLEFTVSCSSYYHVADSESSEVSETDAAELAQMDAEELESLYPIGDLDYDDVKEVMANEVEDASEQSGLMMFSLDVPLVKGSTKRACGSGWSSYIVPDTDFFSLITSANTYQNFEQACINHDNCYGTCGKSKKECDDQFLRDLKQGCEDTYGSFLCWVNFLGCGTCYAQAELYKKAVASASAAQNAYDNSQANACATKYKVHYYQYDGVCIYNNTKWELNYMIKWGSGPWKKSTIKPGYRTMHWSYTEKGNTPAVPYIRFDADLSSGNYQQDFRLETSKFQIQPSGKNCSKDRNGSYFFALAEGNWLGLYPFSD